MIDVTFSQEMKTDFRGLQEGTQERSEKRE